MPEKPTIMVIEDNQTTQDTLKRDLEALGFDLIQYPSSEEAWNGLENGARPDLMVLDFHLPGEDGPNFFRRLHVDPRFCKLPVIPFTALVEKEDTKSLSKVASFIGARDSRANHIQAIVSKKGREDIYQTPPELILAIGHALHQTGVETPPPMKEKFKNIVQSIVQKMDSQSVKDQRK